MNDNSQKPAQISYMDGVEKTIVFPEINRGDLKEIKIDGVSCCTGTRLTKVIRFSLVVMLCLLGFIFYSQMEINSLKDSVERVEHSRHHYHRTLEKYGVTWDGKNWQQVGNRGSGLTIDAVD